MRVTLCAGAAHWELLLRARAVECQAYVIAAAQAGKHNEKRESYGHSLLVDPWGTVVGRLDDPLSTGVWWVIKHTWVVCCVPYDLVAVSFPGHSCVSTAAYEQQQMSAATPCRQTLLVLCCTGIAVVDLDFQALEAVRHKMPISQHRERGRQQVGLQLDAQLG
jgi:predicted amidohydrolase